MYVSLLYNPYCYSYSPFILTQIIHKLYNDSISSTKLVIAKFSVIEFEYHTNNYRYFKISPTQTLYHCIIVSCKYRSHENHQTIHKAIAHLPLSWHCTVLKKQSISTHFFAPSSQSQQTLTHSLC